MGSRERPLPVPPDILRKKRISQAKGGLSARVAEAITPEDSARDIRRKLGLSSEALARARVTLKGWGIDVPYTDRMGAARKVEKLREPGLTAEEKQEILDLVNHSTHKVLSSRGEPPYVPISRPARAAGLRFRNSYVRIFFELLKRRGIPASSFIHHLKRQESEKPAEFRSYIISRADEELATQVFREAEELEPFRRELVWVYGKPHEGPLPNTTELSDRKRYMRIGVLSVQIAGFQIHNRITTEDLIGDDCPVSVFFYPRKARTSWYFKIEDTQALRHYIERRLAEEGILKKVS